MLWLEFSAIWIRQKTICRTKHCVQMVIRHRPDDMATLYIDCVPTERVKELLKELKEDGYSEGPRPSKQCHVYEGEEISLRFSGNIRGKSKMMAFNPRQDACSHQLFVEGISSQGSHSRGDAVFTSYVTGRELCTLPVKIPNVKFAFKPSSYSAPFQNIFSICYNYKPAYPCVT